MGSYYLLRDNRETGPLTLTELKAKALFTTDLIWVDGESTCWKHPTDIPELEGVSLAVKQLPLRKPQTHSTPVEADYVYSSSMAFSNSVQAPITEIYPDEIESPPSFEALKEKYAQKPPRKRVWERPISIGANLMGMVTLLIGLGLSAYMVKKAVENIEFDEPEIASANAVAIEPEKSHASTTTHAAFTGTLSTGTNRKLVPDSGATQTARAAELNTAATGTLSKQNLHTEKKPDEASLTNINDAASGTAVPTINEAEASAGANGNLAKPENEEAEKSRESEERGTVTTSLRLSANSYSVGLLGGISNLEISVSNPLATEVGKAIVEVEYLRKNGKVEGIQTITVSGIAPGGSK
ncbi:MAG: DUF4339 domain-containing protein, partial [Bacteroidota bacterium]|nr:DUF4339 domain-containing protein [Bacteroidota bacterium]